MKSLDFSRCALSGCVAVAMLTGCGALPLSPSKGQDDTQPPITESGSPPQTTMLPHQSARSWILPNAKSTDLLYLASTAGGHVISYPEGKLVGSFESTKDLEWSNLCSDATGNVFLTKFNYKSANVLEYAHGGTSPIAKLHDPGYPWSCSVDPTSGNLAVATYDGSGGGNIAIFPNAQSSPNIYRDPNISTYVYCAYDGKGNLFVDGSKGSKGVLAELPKDSATFTDLTVNHRYYGGSVVSWDGSYVTLADPIQRVILRLEISGSTATVVGTTKLGDWRNGAFREVSFLSNSLITQPTRHGDTGIWRYPAGGKPTRVFRTFAKGTQVYGVTVSVAPNR
jgi:hypothetical protein